MKLYLDDVRQPSKDWILVRTAKETIIYLSTVNVTRLSLDHDLGEGEETGYDVLSWLEWQAHLGNFSVIPDVITIHSANPAVRKKMEQAITSIKKLEFEQGI